jgi:uncharacterized membrane protein YkvA (DUF1232 family)
MLLRLRLLRRIARELPRYGKLAYCLYRDPRVPQRNKVVFTAALIAIFNPLIDLPLWLPVVGEMDALALTILAVKLFVDRAPKEVVAEHQERIALGSSAFDQDFREGSRALRGRAQSWLRFRKKVQA